MLTLTLTEIEKYMQERQNAGQGICFAQFLRDKRAFVVENSLPVTDYKTFWSRLFGKAIKKLDIETVNK